MKLPIIKFKGFLKSNVEPNETSKTVLTQIHQFLDIFIKDRRKGLQIQNMSNEVIRTVLNTLFIFFFFYQKILHAPKAPKALKAPKAQRRNQAKAQNATS